MREIVLADFVLGCSGLRVQACAVPQANFKPDQRCRNDTSKSKISRNDMVKVKVFATRTQLIAVLGLGAIAMHCFKILASFWG